MNITIYCCKNMFHIFEDDLVPEAWQKVRKCAFFLLDNESITKNYKQ